MGLTVSVDVKQHWIILGHWSQFVPNMPAEIRGHEALHHHQHLNCSAQQLKQQLWSTLVAQQWRGPHCLNIVVVLALVHVLLGLPGRSARSSHPTLFPIPNKTPRFCGRKATCLLTKLSVRAQELCESRGWRPNSPYCLCAREAILN